MAKPTFKEVTAIAMNQGVSLNTVRQWRKRRAIPLAWQVKIVKITGGQVTFSDMEEAALFAQEKGDVA